MSDASRADEVHHPINIAVEDQHLGRCEVRSPSRAGARAPLGISHFSFPQTANDDLEGSVPVKRTYERHKPREADLRCKTTLTSIHPLDYEQARIAFNRSWEIGLGLDTAVTLRPAAFRTMTPEERDRQTALFLKRTRSFYAANDDMPELAYLMTREADYGDEAGISEHIHLLIHCGTKRGRSRLKSYLHGRYTTIEAKVKVASPDRVRLPGGEIGDASTYSLKAVSARYAHKYGFPHRFSGPVYGARVFWSTNLNPVRPLFRVPKPKPSKGRVGRPPKIWREAACASSRYPPPRSG
ncbi:hypothetical protein [Methylobacterium segetis]|uniref:hypothetical protein n=1 Tax=Methylobacterium segetis TaxID=2488750 RepID=UPI00104E42F7|nr:hypothetical protein [Methylobacterium segetis]